jgi:two-component system chemotaxis response regulator CheB
MIAVRDTLKPGEKIRILVVDDSVVMRRLISRMVEEDAALELAGTARDGLDALAKIPQLKPHVVTLDVEMPQLDGIATLRKIIEMRFDVRVIMLSSLTAKGSQTTVDALMLGASDYVTKPQGEAVGRAFETLAQELVGKIKQLFVIPSAHARVDPAPSPAHPSPAAPPNPARPAAANYAQRPEIFAIGVSTGGPAALTEALPGIPKDFHLPVVITQHMPPYFTRVLAERLTKICQIPVVEAEDGMPATPGRALIAPGDYHMRVVREGFDLVVRLDQGAQENSCRPAVDVMLRSIAECCKGRAIVAILTGMGQDGLIGVRQLKALGASVFAQDCATSVVWGMPGAIVSANLADAVLPLASIVPAVLMRVGQR